MNEKAKALNASQKKKILAQVNTAFNPKAFVVLEREKKLYITTPEAANMLSSGLHIKYMGLFLGTVENNHLQVSQSAADLFCRK